MTVKQALKPIHSISGTCPHYMAATEMIPASPYMPLPRRSHPSTVRGQWRLQLKKCKEANAQLKPLRADTVLDTVALQDFLGKASSGKGQRNQHLPWCPVQPPRQLRGNWHQERHRAHIGHDARQMPRQPHRRRQAGQLSGCAGQDYACRPIARAGVLHGLTEHQHATINAGDTTMSWWNRPTGTGSS